VPFQAIKEQLDQAYQDRSQQLPRKEYSEKANAVRKQLLDQAYELLSSPTARIEYDAQLLKTTEVLPSALPSSQTETTENSFSDSQMPGIEIPPEQLVGALLILHELGEYEIVINFGDTYLTRPLESQDSLTERADIILTIALAKLELSREQWQQQEYEQAALSGQQGLDLLRQEHLFATIQSEIQNDLYKLRPYRILELLALPENQVQLRGKGMALLQEMLQQRQGIDGKGDDYSGLNLDDFLRFIQQLRLYLTIAEQQKLFEVEAKRPSAVASYLQVYTLIARGFAQKQPDCIGKAQEMLQYLGKRQDVYLEQAICNLLLGQTEAATTALKQTQEADTLAFIQENSEDKTDLLSGLCLYAEKWLKTEVFSHFRDLVSKQVSLKDYFADHIVQKYIEQLSFNSQAEPQWIEENSYSVSPEAISDSVYACSPGNLGTERAISANSERVLVHAQTSTGIYGSSEITTNITANLNQSQSISKKKNMVTKYEPSEYTQGNVALNPSYGAASQRTSRRRRRKQQTPVNLVNTIIDQENYISSPPKKKTKKSYKIKPFRLAFVLLVGLTSCSLLFKLVQSYLSPVKGLKGENLVIQLQRPPLDIPAADAYVIIAGDLSEQRATQVIQEWLNSKSQALGVNHQVDDLKVVLAEPMLSLWEKRAETLQKNKSYYQYKHQVQVRSVNVDPRNPNSAKVEAKIQEKAQYYQNGKLDPSRSYDDNLLVNYELIRQQNQWKIKDGKLL
jgi:hypothetical protein